MRNWAWKALAFLTVPIGWAVMLAAVLVGPITLPSPDMPPGYGTPLGLSGTGLLVLFVGFAIVLVGVGSWVQYKWLELSPQERERRKALRDARRRHIGWRGKLLFMMLAIVVAASLFLAWASSHP
jgi:hypothetical protein